MKLVLSYFPFALTLSLIVCMLGCSSSNESAKLETPDGIDWEAIESQGSQMATDSAKGE
ncbi:hypothetical protein [Allorhodopirellula heiligendammensis]|uniref:Uncharacterized protein n=1 Tax=Allorhodopirellula heiligendammensis TaxID=2714739 RepID=A0A5C6BVS8_9BACT|nr:hypothetical protein [Allorhodopirellula heiligendammensis]TWU15992.1 hypothetical protein Poly21_31960 [Allorhodopirellula heiligendammensis]